MTEMHLPKQVLDLFPIWEYQCPNCNTYVEPDVSFCPNCKVLFNALKWRVIPRFLKSKKVMGEYAHKVLAPKLNPKQRELLFKYFTVIFSDGFESGNFNAWTSSTGAIIASPVHHGNYAAELDPGEEAEKSIGSQNLVYMRTYVRWTTNPSSGNEMRLLRSPNNYYIIHIYNDAGTIKWQLRAWKSDSTWELVTFATPNPTTGVFYSVELRAQRNTAGGASLWVDGALLGSIVGTTNDTATTGVDITSVNAPAGGKVYHDCVVVADAGPIGPEGAVAVKRYFGNGYFFIDEV